jgi:D-sedoheptulose 7-phosphate isomerase
MNYSEDFLVDIKDAVDRIHVNEVESVVSLLAELSGRLFIIGSGGGAAHASHAVCDFRKLCNIEAYAPYDNVTELTARTNDEGWNTTIIEWLKVSRFNRFDALLVISVGGGQANVSENLSNAILYAEEIGAVILSIIGRLDSIAGRYSDAKVIIQTDNITPVTEGLQSVVLHLLCSHPKLQINKTVW